MPGMNGVEEDGSGSDYSMEGAASGADETIDEGFANMIEASLRGKSVDGQISIDEDVEETVESSSLLVEQEHMKRLDMPCGGAAPAFNGKNVLLN